jgi:pimeloyl-ACP methyl ester carboxylesterase
MADRIHVGEVDLAYERRGEGPAVVFVHGLGGSKTAWGDTADALAEAGYDAIAIDMRGAGDSDKPPGPYSIEAWSADLIALLDALRIDRAALVGHSVGCMVVEHAALALEDRCSAVAMLGGAIRWADGFESVLTERAELARAGRMDEIAEAVAAAGFSEQAHAERPELIKAFMERFSAADPEGYAESALATARGTMLEPENVRCPALAFAGAQDVVTPPDASKEVAAAMPHGEFATVSGGAHWCLVELPEKVSERLLSFLRAAATG